jgi:hypothetical protein
MLIVSQIAFTLHCLLLAATTDCRLGSLRWSPGSEISVAPRCPLAKSQTAAERPASEALLRPIGCRIAMYRRSLRTASVHSRDSSIRTDRPPRLKPYRHAHEVNQPTNCRDRAYSPSYASNLERLLLTARGRFGRKQFAA